MITKRTCAQFCRSQFFLVLVFLLPLVFSNPAYSADASSQFVVTYLMFTNDEHYQPRRAYTGLVLQEPKRPLDGVKLGLKEAKVAGRSLGLKFVLEEVAIADGEHYLTVLEESLSASGSTAVVVDLPKEDMLKVVRHFAERDVLFFNARHTDLDLRQELCLAQLFHTLPSHAMLMDGLVQFLITKNWKKYLILEGPLDTDKKLSVAFTRAVKKFGGKVVDKHEFVLSNNPRDRDQTNISIMTGGSTHDVIFIADTYGEFARYVPYQTYSSRLIVGSEGLISDAWHWTWERHGAPQLNQRFDKLSQRRMSATEWAGWAAVKSLTTSVTKIRTTEFDPLNRFIRSADLTVDLYKGSPGNFRPWNNQLRQPLLLHTHTAVVERAPLDGFLHQSNNLDTLGIDEGESLCRW